MCLSYITNAILKDENSIICVSTYDEKNNIYISMPCILNINGIKNKVSFPLSYEENKKLNNSINIIKYAINKIEAEENN